MKKYNYQRKGILPPGVMPERRKNNNSVAYAKDYWACISKSKIDSTRGTEEYWKVRMVRGNNPNNTTEHFDLYVVDGFKNNAHWEKIIERIDFETAVLVEGELRTVRKLDREGKATEEFVVDADSKMTRVADLWKNVYMDAEWRLK